tara:strand:- start:153 stop:323 length:171 start_codon:yes stop_codon:yes gene_type:complete
MMMVRNRRAGARKNVAEKEAPKINEKVAERNEKVVKREFEKVEEKKEEIKIFCIKI